MSNHIANKVNNTPKIKGARRDRRAGVRLPLAIVAIVQHFVGPRRTPHGVLGRAPFDLGVLFTLFAMWFDMESNKDLR